jgi:hypothetical protein
MVARGAKSIAAVLVAGVAVPSALAGRESAASPAGARAGAVRPFRHQILARRFTPVPVGGHLFRPGTCPLVTRATTYVNPLAAATVKPERVDQGVDYAGSGTLAALGAARITYLGSANTGWPGAFVEYQLLAGPDAGCYVYYAEGVTPEPGLQVGDTVAAGQPVAAIVPHYSSGVEIGWAAGRGTKTYAALKGHWTASDDDGDFATPQGKNFSALINALGGPPGKVEG